MSRLYCWCVEDDYDGKHVIEVVDDYNFNLNEVCRKGIARRGYTWKQNIQFEEPIIHDLTSDKILAFQHGTG